MRLTDFERELIKKAFNETFTEGKIYLFGSRFDDTKRGGNIDNNQQQRSSECQQLVCFMG